MYLIRYAGTRLKTDHHALAFMPTFWRATELGLKSCLVCSEPPNDLRWLEPLREVNTKIVYLPRPTGNFDVGCAWRCFKLCRELKAQVFHCDNMHTSPLIGAAAAGVPARIWSKHSMQPSFEACRDRTLRDRVAFSVRTSCHFATQILCVSTAVREELVDLGMPAGKIHVVRNALNACDLRVSPRDAARAALGINNGDVIVTAIGRPVHVKGWDILIEAFAGAAKHDARTRLLLVGDITSPSEAPDYARLWQRMEALGIRDRVIATGYMTDLSNVLGATDVFVMPSRSEGDSNALLQALQSKLPCLATRVGSAEDLIFDGENGLLVPREDVPAMTAALRRLIDDASLRDRFRRASASAKYAPGIEEHADMLIDIYAAQLRERTGLPTERSAAGPAAI